MEQDGAVELYVYYRLPASALPQALAELQVAHAALRDRWPALSSRCLQRAPTCHDNRVAQSAQECDEILTLMEIHHQSGGLDAASVDRICAMLSPWPTARVGDRHVEVFVALPASGVL